MSPLGPRVSCAIHYSPPNTPSLTCTMDALAGELTKFGVTESASNLSMILVMGITGTGKSYFINKLAGEQLAPEGPGLKSCRRSLSFNLLRGLVDAD